MITKDMTIGEVIKMKANAPEILMGFGMGCVGCPSAQAECIEEIEVEVKQLSNKPEEIEAPVKEALPTTEEAKKKKKWEFHLFRKTRSKVEKDKS